MEAVVTGGAGFIGSHVVTGLLAAGAEVRVIDDLSTGYAENVDPRAELIQGDVADVVLLTKVMQGAELVFHEAAHRAVFRSVEHPIETDRANVGGTVNVLVSARDAGVRRVVYASSSSVYGGAERVPTPESAPLFPHSPYAVTKLAGEHYARVFWELFGLETVALRYFNVYGPRQRPESQYAAVIPLFIDAFREERSPVVHGDGLQSRDFTYIDDVVRANILAAHAPAERCSGNAYNIAGGRSYSLLDILDILARVFHTTAEPSFSEPRPGDVRHTRADISAAEHDLDHRPTVPFEEGLRRTVEWFADQSRS